MSTATLGVNAHNIGGRNSSLRRFWVRADDLHTAVVRNPADLSARAALAAHIDSHPDQFRRGIPNSVISFAILQDKVPRRLTFLKHILTAGFPIPSLAGNIDSGFYKDKVVGAVVSDYFYDASLCFLAAARNFPDFLLLLTAPIAGRSGWIMTGGTTDQKTMKVKFGLTFVEGKLSFVHLSPPLTIHYLYPIDSYDKKDRTHDLIAESEGLRIPMPGSRLIRAIADEKRGYRELFRGVKGLHFPHEEAIAREAGEEVDDVDLEGRITRFASVHGLDAVFIKPFSEFGGRGAASFSLPRDLSAASTHARHLLHCYGGFLIQERLIPLPLSDRELEWNVRQYALSTSTSFVSKWRRFRIGKSGTAINTMQGAHSLTEAQILRQLNLTADQRDRFRETLTGLDELGVRIIRRLHTRLLRDHLAERTRHIGGGSTLRPDLISIDLIISRNPTDPDSILVNFLEINDHGSRGIANYDAIYHLEEHGEGLVIYGENSLSAEIVRIMFRRGKVYKRHLTGLGIV